MTEYDTDINAPMSDRDYEVLAHSWAGKASRWTVLIDFEELLSLAWYAIGIHIATFKKGKGASLRGWLSHFGHLRYWRLVIQLGQSRRRWRHDIRVMNEASFPQPRGQRGEHYRDFLDYCHEIGVGDDSLEHLEMKDELDCIAQSLTPRLQNIFRLIRDGLSQGEIGEILGCTPQNISDQWHRCIIPAMRQAKENLDNFGTVDARECPCV